MTSIYDYNKILRKLLSLPSNMHIKKQNEENELEKKEKTMK